MNARRKRKSVLLLAIALSALLITVSVALAADLTASADSWSRSSDGAPGGSSPVPAPDGRSGQDQNLLQVDLCQDIEHCLAPGLANPHGALVILALDDRAPLLTGQALVEQVYTLLGECDNGETGDDGGFATGPDDLFPPAGIDDCSTPGLINLHSASIILASGNHELPLTKQALVEQTRTYLADCDKSDSGGDAVFATLFPPAGIEDCPTIISLPLMP